MPPLPLTAQETPASSAPPASVQVDRGSALYGRPEGGGTAKLAPEAGPPLATSAAKLPLDKLKVPDGFHFEVYASGLANPREMTPAPDGTVFVGTRTNVLAAPRPRALRPRSPRIILICLRVEAKGMSMSL